MANINMMNDQQELADIDEFLKQNPNFLEGMEDDGLMTDTDTGSEFQQQQTTFNPAQLSLNTGFANTSNGFNNTSNGFNNTSNGFNNTSNGFDLPQEMVPMQPQPQMSAMGPCYNPAVGWYYPAEQPASVPPPPMSMFPNIGMTPAASVPTSAIPSGMSTPAPALPNPTPARSRAAGKRKYGPSAYLDARADGRDSVGNDDANYFASGASRRDGRGDSTHSNPAFNNAFSRRQTRPSIVQACICDDREATRIKRPRNAFILFRLSKADEIRKYKGTSHNAVISVAASEMWKASSDDVKQHFKDMAEAEKQRHAKRYPDYKYQPGGNIRSKFGTKACSCGAYDINMARFNEKARQLADNADERMKKETPAKDFVGRASSRQAPAPTAVMVPDELDIDIDALGLPANQRAAAAAVLANLKRKRNDLTVSTEQEDEMEQPRKRRSPRATAGNVNYAEPNDDLPVFGEVDDLFDFSASCKTPSSSQVERFAKTAESPMFVSPKSKRHNSLFGSPSPSGSPPAKNTRSQSRAGLSLPSSPLTDIDESDREKAPVDARRGKRSTSPIKIEDSEDEDENIVVAMQTAKKTRSATLASSRRSTRASTRSTRRSPRTAVN